LDESIPYEQLECPLLALTGHLAPQHRCLLSGQDRTCALRFERLCEATEVAQAENTVFVNFPVISGGAILSLKWLDRPHHLGNVG
jgi:hypothetical protein